MEPLLDFGLEATRWLQSNYPQLADVFKLISMLGREEVYLVLFPLIYWSLDKRLGQHLTYVFLITSSSNFLIKHGLRGPRPYWLDNSLGLEDNFDYGIPSGHVQAASTLYLLLAGWFKRRWIWALALLMVIAMGLSRIYLGAHFVHDVVAGFLLAVLILLGYVVWTRRFSAGFDKRILGQKLLVAISVPVLIGLVYVIVRLIIGEPDETVTWAAFIPGAEKAGNEEMATAVGTLLGMGVGISLENSRLRFIVAAPVWKRLLRYLLGILVTVAIWAGLDAIFPEEPLWLALPLRILRYFLLLLWVSYYGPIAFVRVRLAAAEPDTGISLKM